jgi:hypothetical protein
MELIKRDTVCLAAGTAKRKKVNAQIAKWTICLLMAELNYLSKQMSP